MLDHKYKISNVDPGRAGVFAGIADAPRMYTLSVKKALGKEYNGRCLPIAGCTLL
jgi:hypothetical protein